MASSLSFFLVGLVVLASGVCSSQSNDSDGFETLELDKAELLGLFDVLESLLDYKDWSRDHPMPCSDTPWPGVQCEIGQESTPLFHVTKIHVGPDILNPPCKDSASLSHSLLKLPYLKTLSIFNCFVGSKLTLSSSLFGSMSSLEHLSIVSNPALAGEIPSTLSNLVNLRVLSLSQNSLVGDIPREIGGDMVMLEQLDLSYNNLSGQVPKELGGIENLSILDLSWNSLEGQVPSSLGQLKSLQKIDFGSNKLVGKIPLEIGHLKSLVLLDLSNNFLNGPIPETLSGLDHLEYLIVDHNPLKTRVPRFVGKLIKLQTLSLSGCQLFGTIPYSLASLKHLSSLSLNNNSLGGTIPPSLGTIQTLDLLNLSNNKLSGELLLQPDFVERLGKRLDIRGNNGLCTSDDQRNVSVYLEAPVCLNTSSEPRSEKTFEWPHSNESEGMKPSESRLKEVSHVSLLKPNPISFDFVLCLISSLLL